MNNVLSPSEALAKPMKESDWRALISAIRNGNLIPMVGTDLMRVEVGGRFVTYDHLIAVELAKRYEIADPDLAPFGISLQDATLNDVVSICIRRRGELSRFELHDQVWEIISQLSVRPPRVLQQLAEITDIDLFVTSTCDSLFEQALRSTGPIDVRAYNPKFDKEKEDLAKDARARRGYRSLYYLMGKAEQWTKEFAISDEDLLRFMLRLQDSKYRPKRLFDALRENNLLLLGVNFGDWLARFFLWLAKDRGNLNSEDARNLREYLADQRAGLDRPLVMFLQHFSQSTIVLDSHPEAFVDELHRRWKASLHPAPVPIDAAEPKPPSSFPKGAIFLSYSRGDMAAAKTMYAELTRAGIAAWYDLAFQPGDECDPRLEQNIASCSLFLPLISTDSLERERAYFRKEWKQAVERDDRYFGSNKGSIVPIVIDDAPTIIDRYETVEGMPSRFRALQMYHCPKGRPSEEFIASLRTEMQRVSHARD